jgi:nitrite reductase/ring-hydroxylating ferredoxin subunit
MTALCALDDIDEPGARGFEIDTADGPLDLLVVRVAGALRGYVNSCPHRGTPLEIFPDRFWTADRSALLCTTHGAQFRPRDGLCTHGPCKGKRLTPVALALVGGHVCLTRELPAKSPHTKV